MEEFKRKIISYITLGESVTLVGLSGMGKSRLVREIAAIKIKNHNFYFFDTNNLENDSLETFKKHLETLFKILSILPENIKKLTSKPKITLIIDTIDDLIQSPDHKKIFSFLKSLRDRNPLRISYIFTANQPLNSEYISKLDDLYEIASEHIEYIPLLSEVDFIKEVKEDSKKHGFNVKDEDIKKIITQSGKIPALKKACVLAFRDGKSTDYSKNEKIKAQIEEIIKCLSEDQARRLSECAKGETPEKLEDLINLNLVNEKGKVESQILLKYLLELKNEALTLSENELLNILLENNGKIVTKDEIIERVYPEAKNKVGVSDSSISQLVYRLRNKVKGKYKIEAIHGRGFKIPG